MENTLDSIRPSENPREEMSYLFGRDPSILAYSQRPFPSKDTKKNLLSLYETEEIESGNEPSENSDSQTLQTVKVYLRLKPFPRNLNLTHEQQDAYKIINSTTLITKLPVLDNNMSTMKQSKSTEIVCRKFTFSQTFGPETTQLELFQQTVQQQMTDFLAGRNCTIMTYGTTNSGKSYTLQGTTTSPGLIPRALEFVFANVTTKPNPFYKPVHYSDVVGLNALERAQELEAKTKLLTFSSVDKHQYMNTYKQMQKLLQEESVRPSQCHDAHYSIWVSFAEIYNEIIYDLLSNEGQKKRVPLKLGSDSHGRAFIRGLKTVYVNSAVEAYQVLMAGQYNLKVAATALNAKSSRSHCIFTITLLKYYGENVPDTVEVSTFSFCDLAGSERLKKTLNIGDRLREAQNINTSLLVLGRCLKSIHEGQLTRTKTDAIGPFRESKLTRLFQRALSGKEYLALIVNINPLPNLYVETQNVLSFAAIAKKIVVEKKKETQKKLKSRFSVIVTQSIQTVTDWVTELESVDSQHVDSVGSGSGYVTSEEYMDLANENERLKKEVAVLKNSALIRDFQSRQEMADKYVAMINNLEVDWKQRINDMEIQHEDTLESTATQIKEYYEEKLNQLHRRKRRRTDCSDDSDEDSDNFTLNCQSNDKRNQQLKEKIETLRKMVTELKVMNETLNVEKNKVRFELSVSKEAEKVARNLYEAAQKDICSNKDGKMYIKEMNLQLHTKDEQIRKLKEILDEAKNEYITITSDLRKKEHCIDEQAEIIIENEEKIEDLELKLDQANFLLTEKTKVAEILEEILEQQTAKLSDTEKKMLQMQEEIDQLKSDKLEILQSKEATTSRTSQSDHQELVIQLIAENASTIEEDKNNITKDMQAEIEKVITKSMERLDLAETEQADDAIDASQANYSSDLIKETPLQENSESDRQLKATYNESLKLLVDTGCQVDIICERDCDTDKNVSFKSIQTIVTAEDIQIACDKVPSKEEAIQTNETVDEEKLRLQQYVKDLEASKKELDDKLKSIMEEKKETVCESQEIAAIKKETIDESVKQTIEEQAEKLLELERSLETISKLKDDIIEINEKLEACQMEKDYVQKALDESNKKQLQLENQLQMEITKEQEKDTEITTLQKELKNMIQRNESAEKADDMMEAELKHAISELTHTKDALSQKEQCIKELKLKLENFERNAKIFTLLEVNAKERQSENERLRNVNDELKTTLEQKEHEMEAFMRNRDGMMTKYETLVKNLQEELDREKREVMRYQELFRRQLTPTPKKDDYKLQNRVDTLERRQKEERYETRKEDTDTESENRRTRQTKRQGRKAGLTTEQEANIPVIELSESETKRSTRRNAVPPDSSTERKRTTRRKKLFVADDSFADIEPLEVVPTVLTRNLRSRKK